MFFPFECKNCRKDKWSIRYDTENCEHTITCANCGAVEILEDIFGKRRRNKNATKRKSKPVKKIETQTTQTIPGTITN